MLPWQRSSVDKVIARMLLILLENLEREGEGGEEWMDGWITFRIEIYQPGVASKGVGGLQPPRQGTLTPLSGKN